MNTSLEDQLVAGMREHVDGMGLTRDVLGAARSRHRRRQRVERVASAAGALTLASAVAAAAGVGPFVPGSGRGPGVPAVTADSARQGTPPDRSVPTVQAVLDRAALAASRQPAVRADAFVYTQSVTDGSDTFDVPPRLRPAGRKEVRSWLSVDGRHGALIQSRRAGTNGPWQDDIVVPPGCAGALAPTPSPAPAAGTAGAVTCTPSGVTPDLPTTTDAMLAWLYAHGSDGHGPDQHPSRDARAWNAATDLLGEYLSPPTQAALFRALGRIPGVYLIPGARDEAGRLDVAVARRSGHVRDQVFFDPSTSAYRGVERRLVADDFLGRAGSLLYAVAVTDQAIVASIRQLP